VISLWNGGYYSAYVFHRYQNVKLVAAPELQIGFFGGDPDNFTYPRYNLDFSFFRIYGDDGKPLESQQYFQWAANGAQPGEAVFVIGNPGSTSRLQSVAELSSGATSRTATWSRSFATGSRSCRSSRTRTRRMPRGSTW
jgi:hypothetical protein